MAAQLIEEREREQVIGVQRKALLFQLLIQLRIVGRWLGRRRNQGGVLLYKGTRWCARVWDCRG
jgi:hypothetical protein